MTVTKIGVKKFIMVIPYQRLAPETLISLIESFISREGTDYGASEVCLQAKVEQVKKQIVDEKVVIVFDESTESINLMPRDELNVPWSMQA